MTNDQFENIRSAGCDLCHWPYVYQDENIMHAEKCDYCPLIQAARVARESDKAELLDELGIMNRSGSCEFCTSLDLHRAHVNESRKLIPEIKIRVKFSVALVERIFRKHGRFCRTVDFRKEGKGFKLNYCPECGRYLKHDSIY